MRKAAILAAVLIAPQAYAATEPTPLANDPRVVKAEYTEGEPVILRCRMGNTCRVIFKGPWRIAEVMPSDQALISGIAPPQGRDDRRRHQGAPDEGGVDQEPVRGPDRAIAPSTECDTTHTLTICKTLGHMLTITPAIGQTEQSLQVVMRMQSGRNEVFLNVDFLFSTVDAAPVPLPVGEDAEGARIVRTAMGEAPRPQQHFQTLHLTLNPPAEMPRTAPVVAAQPVRRAAPRVAPPPPVAAPARPLSAPYGLVGDAGLIGAKP